MEGKTEERSFPGQVAWCSTGIPPTGERDRLEPIDGVSVSNQSFESSLFVKRTVEIQAQKMEKANILE